MSGFSKQLNFAMPSPFLKSGWRLLSPFLREPGHFQLYIFITKMCNQCFGAGACLFLAVGAGAWAIMYYSPSLNMSRSKYQGSNPRDIARFLIKRDWIIYLLELIIAYSRSRSHFLKDTLSRNHFLKIRSWSWSRFLKFSRARAMPNLAGSETLYV